MNTDQSPYQIIPLVLDSGERLPCLVERATWLPLRLANRWAVRYRRYRVQASTLAHNLRVVAQIYAWARYGPGLDLDAYLVGGANLTPRQVESLAIHLRTSHKQQVVAPATYNNRLTIAEDFLTWALYPTNRGGSSDVTLERLAAKRSQLHMLLQSLRIQQGISPRRQPLTTTELQAIRNLLQPIQQKTEKWQFPSDGFSPHTALRNWLMVETALELGLRRGELLKLRLDSLPRGASDGIMIRRLPDDPADSRTYEPAVKSAERLLPASRQLLRGLRVYVTSPPPLGRTKGQSPYLFVTSAGHPLSLDAARDMLRTVGKRSGVQPLSWHRFRHTWAEYMADKLLDQPNGLDLLMYLGGWTHPASPQRYIDNALARKAGDTLRAYQADLYQQEVSYV